MTVQHEQELPAPQATTNTPARRLTPEELELAIVTRGHVEETSPLRRVADDIGAEDQVKERFRRVYSGDQAGTDYDAFYQQVCDQAREAGGFTRRLYELTEGAI